jgi:hypothetical protein
MTHENTLKKVQIVADIVAQHYEAGRQDRCLEWVYKNVVNITHPMSLRTFRRYIEIAVNELGYSFIEKDEDRDSLFEEYVKMKPESIEGVQELAKEVSKIKTENRSKKSVYEELVERIGIQYPYPAFCRKLRIAEQCMDYRFNF